MIHYADDGSVLLVGDADPERRQTIDAAASDAQREDAIVAFFAAEPKRLMGVPDQVPLWAAQAALKMVGKFDAIDRAILAMKDSNPPAFFAWTMGNFASRRSALIRALAPVEGLGEADIDALFVTAAGIADDAG